jgi:N-acetylglucosamine-6-phosphate deacetylase
MVKNLIDAGIPLTDAVKMGTLTPARIVGEDGRLGSLEEGKCADICILDDNFELDTLVLNGKKVK